MTTTTAADAERLAALAALAIGQEPPTRSEVPARVVPTGREVFAGGDVPRILIGRAALPYRDGARLLNADAELGDTVLLTPEQAARLDQLGATRTEHDLEAAPAALAGPPADEELRQMGAADLVAYVGQHPDERPRVRTLELARTGSGKGRGPRASVLSATEPTEEQDDEAARIAVTRQPAPVLDPDPVVDHPQPSAPLLDPLASIGTPDRPAALNLP